MTVYKSTTIFHGPNSDFKDHRNDDMFKTQVEPRAADEWFRCKVLNILRRHFYGL